MIAPAAFPSAAELYDQLEKGMQESVVWFGVSKYEQRAVVLIYKTKARNLLLPPLDNMTVEVQSVKFPKGKGAVAISKAAHLP